MGTPAIDSDTNETSGQGQAIAAMKADIFGPAVLASLAHPPVSRILTNVGAFNPASSAISLNSGASWVQAITTGAPPAAALRTRSSSARQNCRPSMTTESRQTRRTFSPASGTVASHEQIRMFRSPSAIGSLAFSLVPPTQGWLQHSAVCALLFPAAVGLASGHSTL